MNLEVLSLVFVVISLVQNVLSSEKSLKYPRENRKKRERKMETVCAVDEVTSDGSLITSRCKRRCLKDLKGYVNSQDELVCFSEKIKARRISHAGMPCTCGYRPKKRGIREYCEPNVHFENITNETECKMKCDEYTAFRLKKYNGPSGVIYCEKEFDMKRVTELTIGIEKVGGPNPLIQDFKCLCGLEHEKKNPFVLKNPFFFDTTNLEPTKDFAATCFKGPFPVEAKRINCGTFCSIAKGFFLPENGEKLICYHDTKRAAAMPPFSISERSNQEFYKEYPTAVDNICKCGAPFKVQYNYYSQCFPELNIEKSTIESRLEFKVRCKNYCETFEAFFIETDPLELTVHCFSLTKLPPNTVSKLDSDMLSYTGPPQPVPFILCQCGLHPKSIGYDDKNDNSVNNQHDDIFNDILNDPYFDNSLPSSYSFPPNVIQMQNSLEGSSSSNVRVSSQQQMETYKMASYRIKSQGDYYLNKNADAFNESAPLITPPQKISSSCQNIHDGLDEKMASSGEINAVGLQTNPLPSLNFSHGFDELSLDVFDELSALTSSQCTSSRGHKKRAFDDIMSASPVDYYTPSKMCNREAEFNYEFKVDELITSPVDYYTPSATCNHEAEFNHEFELDELTPNFDDLYQSWNRPDSFHIVDSNNNNNMTRNASLSLQSSKWASQVLHPHRPSSSRMIQPPQDPFSSPLPPLSSNPKNRPG